MIIGIDTGFSGGMALLSDDGLHDCCDVPNFWEVLKSKTKAGKPKRRRRLNYTQTLNTLSHWKRLGATVMVIEKVHAMPADGGSAAFSFGEAFGAFKAIACSLGFEVYLVTPQAWKKDCQLIGTDKNASLDLAIDKFGPDFFTLKRHHNRADAALIALYAKNRLNERKDKDNSVGALQTF